MNRVKLALGVIAALSILSISSCLWSEEWFPAHVVAVYLPQSILGDTPMSVTVYTFRGDCTVRTRGTAFIALNDSTFEMRVENSSGTPGVGCPGGVLPETFRMLSAPSRRFHVRFVGVNTIDAVVQGLGEPLPASRVEEIFRLQGMLPVPPESLSVLLLGCIRDSNDYVYCRDTLAVVAADSEGIARFEGACTLDGVPYRAEIRYREPTYRYTSTFVELTGQFHCGEPWQTIVRRFE